MKKIAFFVVLIFLCIHCEKNIEPTVSPLDFSKMEISYSRIGGWINTSLLLIDSTGFMEAFHIGHASDSLLNSISGSLSEDQKKELERLFSRFSQFNSYYEPSPWYTDGEIHKIILTYNAINDTVTVYEPENADIPKELNELINKLFNLWESLMQN
jgi:hypothetical protein